MRAVVHDRYGSPDVLRLAEVDQPVPHQDEILIRVRATTVNRTDCHRRAADPFVWRFMAGVRRPHLRILGSELAGEVAAVGADVAAFQVGDHVFGLNPWQLGANAEFVCVAEDGMIARKPTNMTFEEAAAVCDGAISALLGLRAAGVKAGQQVLVYGASGSIGTAGVQLAKHFGANVTAVCDTKNIDTVRSLGADQVIDYTQEDFTTNGQSYDVIFDAVGMHSFRRSKGSLRSGGAFLASDHLSNAWLSLWTRRFGDKRVVFPVPPRFDRKDVLFLKDIIEAGEYQAVIDRTYPLANVVEATKYVETRQKTGNVVLTVG